VIKVISFEEAVRKRPHMYFGVHDADSGLAAAVLRAAAIEPFDWAAHRTPVVADLLVQSELQFTISDNVPVPCPGTVQSRTPQQAMRAMGVALSSH
jgi:hypothetical protein